MFGSVGNIGNLGRHTRGLVSQLAYLLRATFTRADTGALANGTVLNSAALGVENGSLTVVDTSTGTVEVLGNALKVTAAAWNTTGFYGGAVSRAIGTVLITNYNSGSPITNHIGFLSSQTMTFNAEAAFRQQGVTDIQFLGNSGATYVPGLGAIAASTNYEVAVALGGYDVNGVPYKSGDTKTNFTYGATIYIKGGIYTNWTLLWKASTGNASNVYAHTNSNFATYTLDNLRIPDSDLSAVLQPTVLDTFTDTNGTSLTSHTSDVGAGAWVVTGGSGFDIQGNLARAIDPAYIIKPCLADGVLEVTHIEATNDHGLFFRYTNESNRWIAYVNATTFYLYEKTGGGLTLRASTAITKVTNGKITVILDGTSISCFYNGASKLSYTSSAHQTAVNAGMYANTAGQTFDNFAVFPRTSATYESQFGGV